MKKTLLLLLILSLLLPLVSCAGSDVPPGMQLCAGGEELGYKLYVPEGWTLSNLGGISAAYVSRIDSSSVSFTETTPPDGTVAEYFTASLAEFPAAPTVTLENEKVTLGAATSPADEAVAYSYRYEYAGHAFRFYQVFASFEERFFIFTYTAADEEKKDGVTYYDAHLEDAQKVIDNIVFLEKSNTGSPSFDSVDGFILASDKGLAGFSLYVPDAFTPDISSGLVSAKAEGASITMSRATATGVVVSDYYAARKDELSAFVTDFEEIRVNEDVTFGNAKRAFLYEYTFRYNGESYHVLQVLGVTTFNGYVFTYTAKESSYETYLDKVMTAIGKVEF